MESKRGQVVIFVIVALVIVALILLFFLFRPSGGNLFASSEITPNSFLKECIEPEIEPAVDLLAKQGGYSDPEGYIEYQGEKLKYLCYTDDYYETCAVQQPLTKRNFEKELGDLLLAKGNRCMNDFIKLAEERGYTVTSGGFNLQASIIPGKILITFNTPLTLTKDGKSDRYENVVIEKDSEIYDLLFIAQSIVASEAELGDSAVELYMQFYPDLEVRKVKLSDGTTIYKLANVVSGNEYWFSSRSLAWPAGYGLEERRDQLV